MCSGVLGFLIATIFLQVANALPSNLADWFSGIGSISAIIFIIIQIKQQADQHNDQKGHYLQIAVETRPIKQNDGSIIIGGASNLDLVFWATNSGMSPSSFKFIGICVSEDYEKLKNNHEKAKANHQPYTDPHVESMDPLVELGFKNKKFERILSGDVSKETSVPYENVQNEFKGKCNDLYVVYMDVLGTIYGKHFVIDERN